jgi:hypothetical protein
MQGVQAVRWWSVEDDSKRLREEMEMRGVFKPEDVEREVRWFEEFSYYRAVLQLHVEQVMDKPLKARKEIYKRWRKDLGDSTARTYAKFSEYVVEHGRPKWFQKELTLFPDTRLQRPSCVSTSLPVSLST